MLVLDRSQAQRSFVVEDDMQEAGQPLVVVDKALYPGEYVYEGVRVHTRFDHTALRGTRTFADEERYGFWIPGDARAALLAVVLGGPRQVVLRVLEECAPRGLELIP